MPFRPYNGPADGMLGPLRYGYTDPSNLLYGELGGRFLLAGALISQEPLTSEGEKRLPVWSNGTDHLIVACPVWMPVETVEQDTENEGLVWVHQVSRKADHWRHDRHPMEPEDLLDAFASTFKKAAETEGLVTFDSLPRGNYGVGSKSARQVSMPSPASATTSTTHLLLPLLDEKTGETRTWQVSSENPLVRELIDLGALVQTEDGYRLTQPGPFKLRTP